MGIEKTYFLKDPSDPKYEPMIVEPGTYFCYNYNMNCNGTRTLYVRGELKPCPICGNRCLVKT